jgi:hypothetical protein
MRKTPQISEPEKDIVAPEVTLRGFSVAKKAAGHGLEQAILNMKKEEERLEERARNFASYALSKEDFEKRKNLPIWYLYSAILYLYGYESTGEPYFDREIVNNNPKMKEIYVYIKDAEKIRKIIIFGDSDVSSQVNTIPFIELIRTFGIEVPNLAPLKEENPIPPNNIMTESNIGSYQTEQMTLLLDAAKSWWEAIEYDLKNPNRHIAPFKKDVVAWLMREAEERGVELSESLAESIDTIIRCPITKTGGNSR